MIVAAFDLGTTYGYAYGDIRSQHPNFQGSHKLDVPRGISKTRMDRRRDPRVAEFQTAIRLFNKADLVVFEDVQFATYRKQVQLWPTFRTTLWATFNKEVIFDCLDTSGLKKFGANHGSATKEMMARALTRRFPDKYSLGKKGKKTFVFADKGDTILDDNAVDALWLWYWAQETFKRFKK